MNLGRIARVLFASVLGHGITIFMQLVVPPFFLRFYTSGVEMYGEWIALSASISYLQTLNYGIQTYANNQVAILYSGGDLQAAKVVQSSAFRLLLSLILFFVLGGLFLLFLPIGSLLKLSHVSSQDAAITLYLLLVQMAAFMLFEFLANTFMAVGLMHRGGNWANAQRFCSVLSMAAAISQRSSFPVLAVAQLAPLLVFLVLIYLDIRRQVPQLVPSLRNAGWRQIGAILKPSGHFGLIAIAGFLTWQAPVLVIQIVLGPAASGLFGLVRVVFQMSRQLLAIASSVISQDITLLFGQRNWEQLRRLYDLSERVVLFLVPVVSVGSLLMCPFLFAIWLHKRDLYEPLICTLMAILSAVLGIKEHKTQFQSASNRHEVLSYFILTGYAVMLAVSFFCMKAFGLPGFLLTWLTWEIIQTSFILRLNKQLFPTEFPISTRPVTRLAAFMTAAFALAAIPAFFEKSWPLDLVVVVAVAVTSLLGLAGYFVFGADEVRALIVARMRSRFAPGT